MTLDPQVQMVLQLMEESERPKLHTVDAPTARQLFEESVSILDAEPIDLHTVEDRHLPGSQTEIPVRIFRPGPAEEGRKRPLLVHFHGGGWVIGNPRTHDPFCRLLAQQADCVVMSVDYRLAPEHPFPAAVIDSYDALKWAHENAEELGIDRENIAVGGDSAGGNLSAVVSILARDEGLTPLKLQLLIYPATGAHQDTWSHQNFGEGMVLTKDLLDYFYSAYVQDEAHRQDFRLAPLICEDLSGLPAAEIMVAGYDPLRDEGIAYAQRLIEAGNAVKLTNYPGMVHGFMQFPKMVAESRRLIDQCGKSLKESFYPA